MTATDAAQAAQQARPAPDDQPGGAASEISSVARCNGANCEHCGAEFVPANKDHRFCSDKCRYAEYDKRNPRINKVMAKEEQPGLYPGKVFDVSLRNANIRAKSVKGGWKYELVAEMTAEDFDMFNGHDLTGSLFEAQIECIEVAQKVLFKEETANSGRVSSSSPDAKPYGKEAAELYKSGFFFNPHVMEKVGTDAEYLEWLKTQLCCVKDQHHEGDNVAAHVRRISAGAGTGIKPDYSAVPMCDHHHRLQHQKGESAVGGKDHLDRERARHLSRWMAKTIFNQESMGHVYPAQVQYWCKKNEITQYLPDAYKE